MNSKVLLDMLDIIENHAKQIYELNVMYSDLVQHHQELLRDHKALSEAYGCHLAYHKGYKEGLSKY